MNPLSTRSLESSGQRLVGRALALHQRLIEATSPEEPVQPPSAITGLEQLQGRWLDVLAEFDALERDRRRIGFEDVAGMALGVTGEWTAHFLLDRGEVLSAGAHHCRVTMELLGAIEGVESAYFSVMAPGVELTPHRGPNKSMLRAHLTLRTPAPIGSAALSVDGQRIDHRPGVAFVFDDTVEHAAWNRGASDRVTLMIDIRRRVVWWLRPLDAIVRTMFQFHPVRRRASKRLRDLDWARNG